MGRGLSRRPQPSCSGIADFAEIILATHKPNDGVHISSRNGILYLTGLDVVRVSRIHNTDRVGWFLCVAIPPRSGPFPTQSQPHVAVAVPPVPWLWHSVLDLCPLLPSMQDGTLGTHFQERDARGARMVQPRHRRGIRGTRIAFPSLDRRPPGPARQA